MRETYKISVLDDKEFDNLYKKLSYITPEKLADSLGFANPETGEAYIRRTGVKDWDEETIMHEVGELVATISPDEESGIRFKKWGKPFRAMFGNEEQKAAQQGTIFGNVLGGGGGWGALGALGSLALAPLTGGASLAYMPHIATMAGAAQGGIEGKNLKSALLGALKGYGAGNIVSAGQGAVTGAQAGTGAIKGAMEAAGKYGINPAIGKMLGLGSTAVSSSATAGANAAKSIPSWMLPEVIGQPTIGSPVSAASTLPMSMASRLISAMPKSLTVPKPVVPTTPTQPTTQVPNITSIEKPVEEASKGGLGSILGKIASPVGQTLLGTALTGASALPKNAEFEKVASLEQLRNEIATKGASPALYMRARRALEENYTDANTELDTLYNQAGMLDSGEYRDAKAKMMAKKADAEELLAAQIDEQTMNDLLGLTNLDVQMAALKYGADAADIEALRNILGQAGGTMLSSGLKGLGIVQ